MSEYLIPTMALIANYADFFIKKYEEAGFKNARNRIMHQINLYEIRRYFELQLARFEKERQILIRTVKTNKDPRHGTELTPEDRIRCYRQLGGAKTVRDQYLSSLALMPDHQKFIDSLPLIEISPNEIPKIIQPRRRHSRYSCRRQALLKKYLPNE